MFFSFILIIILKVIFEYQKRKIFLYEILLINYFDLLIKILEKNLKQIYKKNGNINKCIYIMIKINI